MYYAIYHQYDKALMSLGDTLFRFETRAVRDETVHNERFDGNNFHWESIDAKTARYYYPAAFRAIDAWDSVDEWKKDTRDNSEYWSGIPTRGTYAYLR